MIDGVSYEMNQRFTEPIEDRTIELEFGTDDLHRDALAQFLGHLPRGSREVVGDSNQGRRAQLHDTTLQFGDASIDSIEAIHYIRIVRITRHSRTQLTRTEDDLADRGQESIQGFGSDTKSWVQGRGNRCSDALRGTRSPRWPRIARRRDSGL